MLVLALIFAASPLMTRSDGNGGHPVYIVVSSAFDPRQPAHVQTHYHGDQATALFGEHMQRIEELIASDVQRVFVLPEAMGNVGTAPTNWSNVVDEERTTREALAIAGVWHVADYTVSAHSSGGRALAKAFRHRAVRADRVVLLDCLYEPAASRIRDGLLAANGMEVIVVRGSNSQSRTDRFAAVFGVDPITSRDHSATVRYVLDGQPAS